MDEMENLREADFAPTLGAPSPYLTLAEARSGAWHIIAQMCNHSIGAEADGLGEFFVDAASLSTAIHRLRQLAARRGITIGKVSFIEDRRSASYEREFAHFRAGGKKGLSSWERPHG